MKDLSKIASIMGKKGGKKSVKVRFKGKTKKEISEIMKKVRKSKTTSSKKMVDLLNQAVLERPD